MQINYVGRIARLKDVKKHPNADRLQLATVFTYQVVVSLDFKDGDLGVYFPSGTRLGIDYCEDNGLLRKDGGFIDDGKRNVKVIKLRGCVSDGLFTSLSTLNGFTNVSALKEGDTISILGGVIIAEKYIPRTKIPKQDPAIKAAKLAEYPYFQFHQDTENIAYNLHKFKEGDECVISLKMHGTSQVSSYTPRYIKPKSKWFDLIRKILGFPEQINAKLEYVCSSRSVIIEDFNQEGGFYGGNQFRKEHHDKLTKHMFIGLTIYYEVVGYVSEDYPIMRDGDNSVVDNEEFIRMYGPVTRFSYYCENGCSDFYVYRMTIAGIGGDIIDLSWTQIKYYCDLWGIKYVPELDKFHFTTQEDLLERVNALIEGPDPIGIMHLREGVCVRNNSRPWFEVYKAKSETFRLIEDSIVSEALEPDMEDM
jgi:tRNA-binding EMAP/Myf-like protein